MVKIKHDPECMCESCILILLDELMEDGEVIVDKYGRYFPTTEEGLAGYRKHNQDDFKW